MVIVYIPFCMHSLAVTMAVPSRKVVIELINTEPLYRFGNDLLSRVIILSAT